MKLCMFNINSKMVYFLIGLLAVLIICVNGEQVLTDGATSVAMSQIMSRHSAMLVFSDLETSGEDTHWVCIDKKTSEDQGCGSCLTGSACDGSNAYLAAFPHYFTESDCFCLLVNDDPVLQTTIVDVAGKAYVLFDAVVVDVPNPARQRSDPEFFVPTIWCFFDANRTITIEVIICLYRNNATWAAENEALVDELTATYYQIEEQPFEIGGIDRKEGAVHFVASSGHYNHHYNMKYTLRVSSDDTSIEYVDFGNSSSHLFEIPDKLYFRTTELNWSVQTTDQYPFGADRLIQRGALDWYPSRPLEVDIKCDTCVFCFDRPECLSRSTRIGVAFGIFLIALCVVYVPRLLLNVAATKKGERNLKRLSWRKVVNFLLCGLPVVAEARCSTTFFSQSSQLSFVDDVKTVGFAGQISLINVGDVACFNIMDDDEPIATLEIGLKSVRAVHSTQFEYWTYSIKDGEPKLKLDSTCPVITCGNIHCDNRCNNDRRCNGAFNSEEVTDVDLHHAGLAQCSQVGIGFVTGLSGTGCFSGACLFCCSDMQRIISYTLVPERFYKVQKINPNPQLLGTIQVVMQERGGLPTMREYEVDLASPNGASPFTVVEGIEFYNSGISTTFVGLPRSHLMTSEETADKKSDTWLVDASVAPLKELSRVGVIQCNQYKRACTFNHGFCAVTQTKSEQRVMCGDDQVSTLARESSSKLPQNINGRKYEMQGEVLAVSLASAGTVTLQTYGNLSFAPSTFTVIPSCRLVTKPVGCYNCVPGFWFDIEIAAENSGTVALSLAPIDATLASGSFGLYTEILLITGGNATVFQLNGFTNRPINKYKLTVSSRTHSCNVVLDWVSSLDDRTRDSVHIVDGVINPSSGLNFDSIGDFFGSIANFFGNILDFFGSLFAGGWFKYIGIILFVILLLCCLGPCIGPIIAGCKTAGRAGYAALPSKKQ